MKGIISRLTPAGLLLGMLLAACESPTEPLFESEPPGVTEFATVLAEELHLTEDQRRGVQTEMRRHNPAETSFVSLWHAASRLQQALTEDQKNLLFRLAERDKGKYLKKLVGVYGACAIERPEETDRPGRDQHTYEMRLGTAKRIMTAVLGLNERQVSALDELHREQCAALRNLTEQAHAGEISREDYRHGLERLVNARMESLESILDELQFEIAKIHDALLVIHARRFIYHIG